MSTPDPEKKLKLFLDKSQYLLINRYLDRLYEFKTIMTELEFDDSKYDKITNLYDEIKKCLE
jgi:hypothetical protein